jgi:16S rRNA (cytidine1402-2'-O)-methyltransferase
LRNNNIGTLFIVSTPIGNLEDITFRAVSTLNSVSLIAAEDTRRSKVLLSRYTINTKMVSYFEHNKFQRISQIEAILSDGKDVAVITDAGTPAISDPAYKLVRKAIEIGSRVEAVPGPSAVLAALVSSGLPTDRFLFEGFLPPKKGRRKRIENMKNIKGTVVIYENSNRLKRTVKQLHQILGDRPAVLYLS